MEVETLPKLDTMITTEMVINGSDADSHNLLENARAMGLQFAGINFDRFPAGVNEPSHYSCRPWIG